MKNSKLDFRKRKRRAFALVLAIAAMAFMVLLTLTLSSVITSKLRIINAQKELRQARSNALLGLSVAISELQRSMGKDNAISVPAAVFDDNPDTLLIEGVKTPYVFGAFPVETKMQGKSPHEAQKLVREASEIVRNGGDASDVVWFVSSEKALENPINQSVSDLSSETVKLAEYYGLSDYPSEYGDSLSSSLKSEKTEVHAGKVRYGESSDLTESAYAWWVSDESMKAKLTLSRPEKYLNENTGSPERASAPSDSMLPQVVNTSFVEELASLGLHPFAANYSDENAKTVRKMSSLDEFAVLDNEMGEWGRRNKNDWTAVSLGIPVDVSQGRLKSDLTAYIQGGYGISDDEPLVRGSRQKSDQKYTGTNFGITNFDKNLPTFGVIKSWANFYKDNGNSLDKKFDTAVKPRAHAIKADGGRIQHGIYPIVQRVSLVFMPAFEGWNPWDPNSPSVKISLLVWPRIWLWNPNNVKLESSTYVIRINVPLVFAMGNDNSYPLRTSWRSIKREGEKAELSGDTDYVFYSDNGSAKPKTMLFSEFLKDRNFKNNPDGIPMISFQVRDLELKPGESVELCPAYERGIDANRYVDMEIAENGRIKNEYRDRNILVPRRMGNENNKAGIIAGSFLTIGLDGNDKPLEFARASASKDVSFGGKDANVELPETSHVPASWQRDGNKSLEATISNRANVPYLEAWWRVSPWNGNPELSGEDSTIYRNKPDQYCRYGYDLWVEKNGGLELLVSHDFNSYDNLNSTLKWRNLKEGTSTAFDGNNYLHRIEPNNQWMIHDKKTNKPDEKDYAESKINRLENFYASDMSQSSLGLGENALSFGSPYKEKSNADLLIPLDPGLGFAFSPVPAIINNYNMNATLPIRIANLRGSQVVSGISSDNALQNYVRRPATDSAKGGTNIGYATIWTKGSNSSWNHSYNNMFAMGYSWPMGLVDPQSGLKTKRDFLIAEYAKNDRYGSIPFFSNPDLAYPYAYMVAAMFDYPRGEHDLMSLGMLNHANLSPMMWQATYAFGESRTSPHLDRENVSEPKVLNENELLDISYALNASMWDRFYLSTMPQSTSVTPYAGMRMPNTRHVITSMPSEKNDLYGGSGAFAKSAAYIGVDGAFNVNSTSYEAWRAFLGGMLGTTKKTVFGNETINTDGNDLVDPDKFKMPNPGDMNPIYLPEEESYFTYRDVMVGRKISESEIDQLAREIVKEVKRRAPFFSLADFVNRRLISYSEAKDLDLKYQSLMGTLAAAIQRSVMDSSRPRNFFNNPYMDASGNSIAVDNSLYLSKTRKIPTQVKKEETQYIEQATGLPSELPNAKFYTTGTMQGFLQQADILAMIGPFITVRGDTFTIRAYGESKNKMTGTTAKAYCEAVVQRSSAPVDPSDDIEAPESAFGRRFNVVSFRWLSPAEL